MPGMQRSEVVSRSLTGTGTGRSLKLTRPRRGATGTAYWLRTNARVPVKPLSDRPTGALDITIKPANQDAKGIL